MTILSTIIATLLMASSAHPAPNAVDAQPKDDPSMQVQKQEAAPRSMADTPIHPPSSSSVPDESSQTPAQSTMNAAICSKPSGAGLESALARSPLRGLVSLRVWLEFNAKGKVHTARLHATSGDATLDKAVVAWALKLRMCPGAPGAGYMPMQFQIG